MGDVHNPQIALVKTSGAERGRPDQLIQPDS
jgi:hypothetical protein